MKEASQVIWDAGLQIWWFDVWHCPSHLVKFSIFEHGCRQEVTCVCVAGSKGQFLEFRNNSVQIACSLGAKGPLIRAKGPLINNLHLSLKWYDCTEYLQRGKNTRHLSVYLCVCLSLKQFEKHCTWLHFTSGHTQYLLSLLFLAIINLFYTYVYCTLHCLCYHTYSTLLNALNALNECVHIITMIPWCILSCQTNIWATLFQLQDAQTFVFHNVNSCVCCFLCCSDLEINVTSLDLSSNLSED